MSKAMKRLLVEYQEINKDINPLYSLSPNEDDFLTWDFIIIGPQDTLYENGLFRGKINFTKNYPNDPPNVIFNNIVHPNIYKTGQVCISILHKGSDYTGYEKDIERWLPSHGINTIMLSIISMLAAPNFESPANMDASLLCKNDIIKYKKLIYSLVQESHN